jgi:murein DD-endopeptidase MepM/ murein hydrolase activator NlpD
VTPYHPQFKITLLRVRGKIQGSILGSVLAKVNSNFVASRFNDAYAFDIKSRRSIRNGADYWFTVQKKYDQDQFIKFGEILETSLEFEGRSLRKKFVRNQNGGVFLNAESIRNKKPLYAPVNYLKIASLFQPNRLHPITGRRQAHLGVDFELPIGEPVLAARQGFVKRYGYHRAAGNFIVILHSHGIETAYNHLSKIDKKIYQGRKILAGDKIGEIGCTGYCTRAHLHFAVKQNGQMVNPMKYLMPYPFKMENRLSTRIAEL